MVHCFKLNGFDIALDSASGSVHMLDELAYETVSAFCRAEEEEGCLPASDDKIADALRLKLCGRYGDNEIKECVSEVRGLIAEDKLFSMEEHIDAALLLKKSPIVKALCLHVAHTCNLNCEYCFAAQGKYNGERALMSFETGRRALDFLVENSGSRRNLEVDFFGGEPLMNWKVVKELVAYARSIEKDAGKNFRFTLTTNGMLLDDEVTDFCNREMDNVVLSLDGRREVHDKFRKTVGGEGSYDAILPKFKKFVDRRGDKSYYVRGTYTHFNTDFTSDILKMADEGFRELSMEPVVCPPGEKYALTKEDLPVLFRQYEMLAEEMNRRRKNGVPFTFYHYMLDLEHGPCIYKRIIGCGSGTEYMAVTPTGELYPCHQFVGNPEYKLGDVWTGVTNTALREKFQRCNVYSRKECESCWAKFYCSGGCAANAFHASGDINGVYAYGCELFKKRIECAIYLKCAEIAENALSDK